MNKIKFLRASWQLLALFLLPVAPLIAQEDEYVLPEVRNEDYTYRPNIRSVRLYPSDSQTDYPIVALHSGTQLILEFDDLDGYNKNYYYKIIHCNADWTPSTIITPIDYIEGFQENRLYSGQNAIAPHAYNYVHYELSFPNDDIKLKKSGNYLLKVYLDNDENEIVLTRRFMVFDTKVKVVPEMRRSATPPYAATHQEFRFSVQYASGITIANPNQDIKVMMLQNGRWDNMLSNLQPTFVKRDEIVYDLQGKYVFPALREFRPLDLRSFRSRAIQVRSLYMNKNNFDIELFDDFPRPNAAYIYISDLNGKYVVESFDFEDEKLRGEYGDVKFFLNMDKISDADVYLIGGFSDWQLYDQYKLAYDEQIDSYVGKTLLKNGYYNYMYAVVSRQTNAKPDLMRIEGSSYETENDYIFLVYYRPYGGRYDELIAVQKANSRPR